ncbi:hypothetical protein QBC32DRAFT_374158 [Pseudoneurospora amorphoporcata]|uniref:Uncharacterized protein n=1 Tax=Pseudoneurospora amorphoporcata TaxID=241081 RepID=A0AAN6NL76_9PEZI|nr:hypothetical protein QBC32DRAFT_374158 [Pseudoneurospora amorphoporcata]
MDHTNPVHLSHPQSEKDFLSQYYARLSLADTDADKKSLIPTTIGLTITTVTGIASTSTPKAMEDYTIEYCCDYMKAKNLLRGKEKLIELLQNELSRTLSIRGS